MQTYLIRDAYPDEFEQVGQLMIAVYAALEGFPSPEEQPGYYSFLANVGSLTEKPGIRLLVAVSDKGEIDGAVVYFSQMQYYGSGGTATAEKNAAGFRLLAVSAKARGCGLGKQLTQACINLASDQNQQQLIIHSTRAMQVAWGMYEKIGFERAPELDFQQGELPVFGFRLHL